MGGLVTRAFLLSRRIDPDKVPMIYFFSTPTGGANIADIASKVSSNSQLRDMLPLERNGYLSDLLNQWLRTADEKLKYPERIASYCAYELLETGRVLVVQQLSAILLCNREVRQITANHLQIVKPRSDRDDAYVYFKTAYERVFGKEGAAIRQAVAATPPALQPGQSIESAVGPTAAPRFFLRRVKSVKYVEVDCEQTRIGEIELSVPLNDGERVLEVSPYFDHVSNLKQKSVSLVMHQGAKAVLHYQIRGLDREFFGLNCPGGGNAYIAATFVIGK